MFSAGPLRHAVFMRALARTRLGWRSTSARTRSRCGAREARNASTRRAAISGSERAPTSVSLSRDVFFGGVDSHFKRHFPSPEENADNRSWIGIGGRRLSPCSPPTPPDVRVRIRRFGKLRFSGQAAGLLSGRSRCWAEPCGARRDQPSSTSVGSGRQLLRLRVSRDPERVVHERLSVPASTV
jgi:hypothetical protein